MNNNRHNSNSATRLAAARRRICAPLLLAALVAPAARADSRADAKRHFREGMSLIAAGQVERGIAELKQAYAIKPHPDVLYDIAKAYVDLGNIPEALSYFRQYVATDPEDKDQVVKVMSRLQAAISAAPAALRGAPVAQAAGQLDAQQLLAQIQALIARSQGQQPAAAGPARASTAKLAPAVPVAPAEEEMFEAATISAQTRATAKEISGELSSARDPGEDLFEEQVVTAGVRSSSEARTPASLTIIGEDEIRLSGAPTAPEILRRVPGIDVAEMNPSDTNISIRGFNR